MTNTRPRNPRLTSIAFAGVAIVVLTAAVRTPRPQSLSAQTPAVATRVQSATPSVAPATAATLTASAVEPTRARASIAATISPPAEATPARATASPSRVSSVTSASASASASVRAASAATTATRAHGGSLTDDQIRALIAVHYPSVLKGDPNINLITFIVDANGDYVASSSGYQAPLTQAERERAETNAARDAVLGGEMRGRGGRGNAVAQAYAIAGTDSTKAAADQAAVRNRLLEGFIGDSLVVNVSASTDGQRRSSTIVASGSQGTLSGLIMAGKDTLVSIGSPTSLLKGLRIDADSIDNVQVLKSHTLFGPLQMGVIVIQLK
jgi:hypothetical protein